MTDDYVVKVPADGSAPTNVVFNGIYEPESIAVDGSGNLFLLYGEAVGYGVTEMPAGGGALIPIPFTPTAHAYSESLAIDSQDNVFVLEILNSGQGPEQLHELPADGGAQIDFPYNLVGEGGQVAPPDASVALQALATGVGALESETTLQFYSAYPGEPEVLPLTIYNYGVPGKVTVATKISGPSYTIIGSTCTAGITAGSTCVLQVQFNPQGAGTHDDTLTLTPSAGAVPTTIKLLGMGSEGG